jgi:mercuric ion binding protein
MGWQTLKTLLVPLVVLFPLTGTAEVIQAVISVDGMSCPFCAFGVEKRLKTVNGTDEVAVDMKKGTATLVAEEGKSLEIGQIAKAVRSAGFTPGLLRISVVGTVKKDHESLLLDVRNTTLTLQLVELSPQLKPRLLDLANAGATVILTGTLSEVQSDLPTLTPETVLEVTP